MKIRIQSLVVVTSVLVTFALQPMSEAVVPPPDGGGANAGWKSVDTFKRTLVKRSPFPFPSKGEATLQISSMRSPKKRKLTNPADRQDRKIRLA
jgi:hypothetical protein